jgi:hypothetical protein
MDELVCLVSPMKELDRKMYDLVCFVYSKKETREEDGRTGVFSIPNEKD